MKERAASQDFGIAAKEFMDAMQSFRKTAHTLIAIVKYGGHSRAAVRYTTRKIDELLYELQACKEYLEGLE